MQSFKTSETYLVNKDRLVVTPTRYIKDVHERKYINSKPVTECLSSGKEMADEYLDYRGIQVVGVSMCLVNDGLVLMNEIASSEAYVLYDELVQKSIVVGVIVLLVIIIITFLVNNRVLLNLVDISRAAEAVSSGDFSVRLDESSKDEIGRLSVIFNTMLNAVENSKKKLSEQSDIMRKSLKANEEQGKSLDDSKKATLNLLEDSWASKEKLEREGNRLNTVLTSIGDGLILVDREYRIVLVNPKASEILVVPKEDLLGKDLRTIMKLWKNKKDELLPLEWPIEKMFLTKLVVVADLEDELSLTTATRTEQLPVALYAAPLAGEINGGVFVIRNISKDRELDDSKRGFISVASHQLRTPLTAIRWYAEMLISEDAGALNEAQKDFLKEIHDGVQRLYQTVDLLLGISRVEGGTGRGAKSQIDLALFSEGISHELAPLLAEKNLGINVAPPEGASVIVHLDILALRQVVLNLFSNAIRYTEQGGLIEARWFMEEGSKTVTYSVHDNGMGIPENVKSRIFTKFFRADNALSKVPDGSGLGLSLVKELINAWGGKVWFDSEEGKGTTFYFTIPPTTPDTPLADN